MKQLILTFFSAILLYCLFFDKGTDTKTVETRNKSDEVIPTFTQTYNDTLINERHDNIEPNNYKWTIVSDYGNRTWGIPKN